MKICDNCGHRNFKLIENDKKKPVCSECGELLPKGGAIKEHGHGLGNQGSGDGCYSMGKIKDSDYQ